MMMLRRVAEAFLAGRSHDKVPSCLSNGAVVFHDLLAGWSYGGGVGAA